MNYHSDYYLHKEWKLTKLGLLIFPLLPTLGILTLVFAVISTFVKKWRTIITSSYNIALTCLGLWLAIATFFAWNRQEAFLGLANLLPFFGVFAAFSALIKTPAQLRQLSWVMVISSIPVIILGFGQLFWGWSGLLNLQIIFGWILAPQGNPPGRMASVFMYANILAIYLSVVFILGLGLWIEKWKSLYSVTFKNIIRSLRLQRSGRKKFHQLQTTTTEYNLRPEANFGKSLSLSEIFQSSSHQTFIFLTVTMIGNGVALILTNSRNAWGLVVFAGLAYAIYLSWNWLVGLVMTAVATVFGAAFAPAPLSKWLRVIVPEYFWERLTDRNFDRPVAILRTTQWQFAGNMTREKPFFGWGLRNFTPLYEAQMQTWLGHPHNLFLMLTAETGIPATLFLCGWVGWILGKAVLLLINWSDINSKEDRLIFFSYLVAFAACTIFNMFDVTLFDLRVNTIGWLLLAAICGVSRFAEVSSQK
ncbi:MAG: O-antigen ligase family protein [Okeania sp. SIO2F4]|uniref:O-antigen ligase family protein n=1 Tax=Okeania sp. SIO2F4 TaxID=2607790 RepID=UPI00142CBA63|nr:O-antigen ligase family protein [Okeania sp. SIO2F4]NES04116.1 O-antigen ligase family protein [Okeania sp. SIO2F4]